MQKQSGNRIEIVLKPLAGAHEAGPACAVKVLSKNLFRRLSARPHGQWFDMKWIPNCNFSELGGTT